MVPIIIICRDRVTPLKRLLAWLELAGHEQVFLLDNMSTYEPMVEYLHVTPHTVIRSRRNTQRSPWIYAAHLMFDYFVVSDPDVVPTEECPVSAVEHFRSILDTVPMLGKVGFSLKIDDLPDHYAHKQDVIAWESQFWGYPDRGVHHAPLDTTFALYRPGEPYRITHAARTAAPYVARHLTWYIDSANPSEEDLYYRKHMSLEISNWNQEQIPPELRRGR